LIDCCFRTPEQLGHADVALAAELLKPAASAVLSSTAALSSTTAVAGLGSALIVLFKRVLRTTEQVVSGGFRSDPYSIFSNPVLAVMPLLFSCGKALQDAAANLSAGTLGDAASSSMSSSNSSSSSGRARANAALLAVLYCRCIVLLDCVVTAASPQLSGEQRRAQQTAGLLDVGLRLGWKATALDAMQLVLCVLSYLGMAPAAAPAAAAAVPPAAAAAAATRSGDEAADAAPSLIATSRDQAATPASSSGQQQVECGYLLRLHQSSKQWRVKLAGFDIKWPAWRQAGSQAAAGSSTAPAAGEQVSVLYADAVGLCRALLAAAPLQLGCNNADCGNLVRVSEASAANKTCKACQSCVYCCEECQKVDWPTHKHACKRLRSAPADAAAAAVAAAAPAAAKAAGKARARG
jgi:hypothetical protein